MGAAIIITIDGPAGSGKSTTARKLAARLGIPYLDTGAMYRVVTLAALNDRVDLRDETALTHLAESDRWQLDVGPTHIRVTLDGQDVSEEIRGMRVSDNTRHIARVADVRRALIERQRRIGRLGAGLVTEGRDQGTAAFPDADAKFFLDAAIEKRAERRFHELLADGEDVSFTDVLRNLAERDETDSARHVGPLRRPDDAVALDTTHLTTHDVIEQIVQRLAAAGLLDRLAQRGP